MASGWFLLAALGLCWTSAYSAELGSPVTDPRYDSTLEAVIDILWETFKTEIQYDKNALIFSIPFARDVVLMDNMLDEETKNEVRKSLQLYKRFGAELQIVDEEVSRASLGEMRFKTIFLATVERPLHLYIHNELVFPNDRYVLVPALQDKELNGVVRLSEQVENSLLGSTCEVRYCLIQEMLSSKPPFALLTLATWNITSVEGMHNGNQWIDVAEFTVHGTGSILVNVMRGYGTYDYAEFVYPRLNDCTGRVLRLRYKLNFNVIFVIPSDEKMCSSSEDLWKNVQHVNLNGLKYEKRTMFVSLPLFKVSANIDLKLKLKSTAFARAFDQESSQLYNALAFQAAEVIFNPEVFHKNWPIPTFGEDSPIFQADRPFFFALFPSTREVPIFAGLINNPGCTSECDKLKTAE